MPSRRLIVQEGHVYHYGVDPGTTRVAIAIVGPHGLMSAFTVPIFKAEGGKRLGLIYSGVYEAAFNVALRYPCGLAWVEQPSGKFDNPALSYATGVIQAAMHNALDCVVETVPSNTWKLGATGFGGHRKTVPHHSVAGKRQPVSFDEYGVAKWAVSEMGYTGRSLDEVDAIGVAAAARNAVMLEER